MSLTPLKAFSYPQTIRFEYNCGICHVDPTGGGPLTPYGRKNSTVLASGSLDGEEKALWGALDSNEILMGGHIRYALTNEKNFLMQAEVESALKFGGFYLVGSGGLYAEESGSRSHYVLFRSPGWALRMGRFRHSIGVALVDHTAFVRRANGFNPGLETYGAELYNEGDYYTALISMHEDLGLLRVSGRYKTYEVGANGAVSPDGKRGIYGFFLNAGINQNLHLLAEYTNLAENRDGDYYNLGSSYLRVASWLADGLELFVTRQDQTDYGKIPTSTLFSAGFLWIPRPHFELQIEHGVLVVGDSSHPRSVAILHWWL